MSKYLDPDDDGTTTLPDGRLLREAVAAEPESYFGPAHVARFGDNPALLVKLLDAGERLPVHCHPDRAFARAHLGSNFGKTEAWIIIATPVSDPHVYLGFNRDVEARELAEWFESQDSAQILSSMNRVAVGNGDAIYVPAGTAHAVGAGVFIAELQEPTDFSVMLEWRDFGLPDRHDDQLGVSAELSLQSFNRKRLTDADLARYVRQAATQSGWHRDIVPRRSANRSSRPKRLSSTMPSSSMRSTPSYRGERFWQPRDSGVADPTDSRLDRADSLRSRADDDTHDWA